MAALTVSKYLGMLQQDPFDAEAFEGIKDALASGDASRIGDNPVRLLEAARVGHEGRKEYLAAAWLIEAELPLVSDDRDFQGALLKELGRTRREELLDDAGALAAYRRAAELLPDDEDVEDAVLQLEQLEENWRKLADRFVKEAEGASEATLRASMFTSAASLVWQYRKKGSAKETDELFGRALEADPGDTRAARLHALTLRSRKRFADMASTLESAADHARDRDEKVNLFVAAGRVHARLVKDLDKAASCYERVQDFVPGHEEALEFLVEYFTEREHWDHLVALYEDALRSRRHVENEQGMLLQLGMVHWRIRGDLQAAEPYFARIRKFDPAHPGMLEFYRELYKGGDPEGRLLGILGEAQRLAGGNDQKLVLAMELARQASATNHVERAIDAWKSVQRLDPSNTDASVALRELYRRGEKWNALVEVLRAEMDALPVDAKDRRVAILRELVPIYRDKLGLDVMVINTFNAILQEVPGDEDALRELARTYESMGRWSDLIQILTRQAESSSEPSAKVVLLTQVASLWIERFANYNQATKPLEEVIAIEPENREALAQLKQIYSKKRAWGALFEVMLKESQLASDPDARLEMQVELAKLAGEKLHRHGDAISLWRQILAQSPDLPGALDNLEKLAEREKDWGTLAETLERRVSTAADTDTAVKTLQKLGTIYGEHLSDPVKAATAWKRVLEIEPKNGRALRTLRESFLEARDWDGLQALYAEANDWEGLVEVLGTAAERAEDPSLKVELSFRAARLYADPIGEPHRAFRNYERILSVDPVNVEAARALAPIYEKDEKWARLVTLLEGLLAGLGPKADAGESLAIVERLRSLCRERLGDDQAAFRWALRAYAIRPEDADVVDALEKAAAAVGGFDAVAAAFRERIGAAEPEERVALRRRVATISGERLGKPEEAMEQLEALLDEAPEDAEAVAILDRIYRSQGTMEKLRGLYVHRLGFTQGSARAALLVELGKLEEEVLGDAESAAGRYREVRELEPENEVALRALDALAQRGERWEELADVLAKRAELELDGAPRVQVLVRLGDVRREKLSDVRGALEAYAEALSVEPANDTAVAGLEAIQESHPELAGDAGRLLEAAYTARSSFEKLAGVLQQRLAATKDEGERRSLRLQLAELAATELGDTEGAYRSLESAFMERPDDSDLWDRLASAAEAAGKHEGLAQAYTTAIEAGDLGDSDVLELARRAAELYDVILGRPSDADGLHRRVLALDPMNDTSFAALKELYTNTERWDDLQSLYRARIAETLDGEAKRELLLQVCFLFEEILDDVDRAIAAYEEVLELTPDHVPTRRALDRLYRRAGRWAPLVGLVSRDLEASSGQEALDLTFEIAEIYETRLGQAEQAVDYYERVLQENATHLRAQEALERLLADAGQRQRVAAILEPLYTAQGAWPQLARVLEVQLEAAEDPGSRVALLLRVAEIHEQKLRDTARAFDALCQVVALDPSDATSRQELARLARARGGERDRAEVLEKAIAKTEEPYLVSELLFELARLWDEEEQVPEKAEGVYQRLLEADGNNPDVALPACRALERIHVGRGDHAALAEDLRRQVRLEDDQRVKSALLVRLAELLELTLDDLGGAIGAHRERLEIDPADVDALRALERLYERKEAWPELIATLEAHDQASSDSSEQQELVLRIGEIHEERLGSRDLAITTFADALSRFGPDLRTLTALERLYRSAERWEDLLGIVELLHDASEDSGSRAERRFQAAELMRTRTGEMERAIEAYGEVLAAVPGHPGTIAALEDALTGSDPRARAEGARVLVPYYEAHESYESLVQALEVMAETEDPVEKLRALRRAAEVADVFLDNAKEAFRLLGRAIRVGLEEPDLEQMLLQYERFAGTTGAHEDYVALLKDVYGDILNADLQTQVLMSIAQVAREKLDKPELAREHYAKVLENRPDHLPALDQLEQLHARAEDYPALLEVLKRKGELTDQPAQRLSLLLQQAELCEKHLDDVPGAIDALEAVLVEQPNAQAYEGLERLYAKAEKWDDLVSTYERQLEGKVGDAVELHYKLGRTCLRRLEDPYRGLDHLREALRLDHGHEASIMQLEKLMEDPEHRAAAAEILEPVFLARMDWPKVTGAIEARLSAEAGLEERKVMLRRLGSIHEDYLEDLEGAMDTYARLFREDPVDTDIWDTLTRLANALDAWGKLAEIYAKALDEITVDTPETARLATITGRLFDERVNEPSRSAPYYARALRFDPTNREVFDSLEAVYRRIAAWESLLELYRERTDVAETDAERGELLRRAAMIREEKVGDAAAALDVYREAIEIDPSDATSIEALDRLLTQSEQWSELTDHLRFRIDHAPPHEANDLKFRLGTLLWTKLQDTEAAVDVFEEIVLADPRHVGAVGALERLVLDERLRLRITQILEPIYRDADEWKKLIAILEAQVALSDDPAETVRLLGEIARLHEARGGNTTSAFEAWARAMAADPLDEGARAEIDRLALAMGAWDQHVQAYEQAIAKCDDPMTVTQLLTTVARVHDEKRGDPRSAIETYERLLQHDAEDPSPLDALEALHTMVGDWRGLVDVMSRKVERSFDPIERAELLRRNGSVLEELLNDPAAAIEAYQRAAQEDDRDPIALEALDRLFSSGNQYGELATTLERRIEVEEDPDVKVELGLRLGDLCETQLNRSSEAIEAFVRVLEVAPMQPVAVASLARLYERQAMWPELLENLRAQAQAAPHVGERVRLIHRAGEILERELDDAPEALTTYRQALAEDSRHEPSIQALVRISHIEDYRTEAAETLEPLLRIQERWDDLVALLRLLADGASDPFDKKQHLRALAEVHEGGRRDTRSAFDCLAEALAQDSGDEDTANELERLAGTVDGWARLAQVLRERADATTDPMVARGLLVRLARVAEEELRDDSRAIEALTRALDSMGDDEELLGTLDRLHTKTQGWSELGRILERRVSMALDDAAKADLLMRLGELRRDRFQDMRGAFAAFQEMIEMNPADARAVGALQGLSESSDLATDVLDVLQNAFRQTGSTEQVASLYEVRIRLAESDAERVSLLTEVARIWEDELRNPAKALECVRRAFELEPRDEALLAEVERLAEATGAWEALRGMIEKLEAQGVLEHDMQRDLNVRAAVWYQERLGDAAAAEVRLRAAIQVDSDALEAHERLAELLRGVGRDADLVAALRAWAKVDSDEFARRDRLREAARLAESSLGDVKIAGACYEAILLSDPTDAASLDDLARIRTGEEKWGEVVGLLERLVEVEMDPDRRLSLRRRIAQILAGPLGDAERATEAFVAVLDERPDDLEALTALEALHEKAERWDALRELLERRLDLADSDKDRIAARVRLARLDEQAFGRRADAMAQLREILEIDPRNPDALDELERLLGLEGSWDEQVELLERRIGDAASAGDIAAMRSMLERLAVVHRDRRQDLGQAIEVQLRLLDLAPDDVAQLQALVALYEQSGDWAQVASTLDRVVGLVPTAEAVATCHRIADLAGSRLGDPAMAAAALRRAFDLDSSSTESLEKLKAHYTGHEQYAELAEMLAIEERSTENPKAKVDLLKKIAGIYREKLGDPATAATFFERVVERTPDDRDALLPLCDLYIAAGRQGDAVPVLEKIIASFGGRRSKELAQYHHRLGQALEGMGNAPAALEQYDAAFKIDLTNVAILRDLGKLTHSTGDLARSQKTFRALLLQKLGADAGISKADVYYYLGDISVKEGDNTKAVSMLERAIAEEKGHTAATALLAQLKG